MVIPIQSSSSNPHDLPLVEGLVSRSAPTFYLPPLLSSLPTATTTPYSPSSPRLPHGSVDPASSSLHKALHGFHPVSTTYAELPYTEAFNWDDLRLDIDLEREWYCVVFRSKRNQRNGTIDQLLYEADAKAHAEAIRHGGLLMYWYGVPDPVTGINLATCIWQSRKHARAAIGGPEHIKAMKLASTSYEMYTLERHVLRKKAGEEGVVVENYVDGEVGW